MTTDEVKKAAEARYPGRVTIFALRNEPSACQVMFGADLDQEVLIAKAAVIPPTFEVPSQIAQNIFMDGAAWSRRWIPVGERLPEFGEDVLAVDRNGDIHLVCLSRVSGWTTGEYDLEAGDVTHWHPLPAAPKEGE